MRSLSRPCRRIAVLTVISLGTLAGCQDSTGTSAIEPEAGVYVESVSLSYDNEGNPNEADTSVSTEELPIAVAPQPMSMSTVPASQLALRGFLIEFTSPVNGDRNTLAVQFNSTGDAPRSMTWYLGDDKLWQGRLQWTPSEDMLMAYNVVQDMYDYNVLVAQRSDSYSGSGSIIIPPPALYDLPFSIIFGRQSQRFVGPGALAAAADGTYECTQADAQFLGDMVFDFKNKRMLKRVGHPDAEMTPLDPAKMQSALRCIMWVGRSVFNSDFGSNGTYSRTVLNLGLMTAVVAGYRIWDALGRLPSPNDIFSQQTCTLAFGATVCEWVGTKMTQ